MGARWRKDGAVLEARRVRGRAGPIGRFTAHCRVCGQWHDPSDGPYCAGFCSTCGALPGCCSPGCGPSDNDNAESDIRAYEARDDFDDYSPSAYHYRPLTADFDVDHPTSLGRYLDSDAGLAVHP